MNLDYFTFHELAYQLTDVYKIDGPRPMGYEFDWAWSGLGLVWSRLCLSEESRAHDEHWFVSCNCPTWALLYVYLCLQIINERHLNRHFSSHWGISRASVKQAASAALLGMGHLKVLARQAWCQTDLKALQTQFALFLAVCVWFFFCARTLSAPLRIWKTKQRSEKR